MIHVDENITPVDGKRSFKKICLKFNKQPILDVHKNFMFFVLLLSALFKCH